jgi:hypothetical protein
LDIATLTAEIKSLQKELEEHKRICEAHKEEVRKLADEFIRANAATSPWIKRGEALIMALGAVLLSYIAVKVGLMK